MPSAPSEFGHAQGPHHLLGAAARRDVRRSPLRTARDDLHDVRPAGAALDRRRSVGAGTSCRSGRRCACAAIVGSTCGPDGDELVVDAFFRDSCWEPDGSEIVLHEYDGRRRASTPRRRRCGDRAATPHVLPFPECQWAPQHVVLLVGHAGARVPHRRADRRSPSSQCCTHLNDMLRCLAEVPALAAWALPDRAGCRTCLTSRPCPWRASGWSPPRTRCRPRSWGSCSPTRGRGVAARAAGGSRLRGRARAWEFWASGPAQPLRRPDAATPTASWCVGLIAASDVFVDGWATGVAARLGLAADDLCAENPQLVHARGSARSVTTRRCGGGGLGVGGDGGAGRAATSSRP